MVGALKDLDKHVQKCAVEVMGKLLEGVATAALPYVVGTLEDKSVGVR